MSAQTLKLTVPDNLLHAFSERVAELLRGRSAQPHPRAAGGVGEPWLGVQQAAQHLARPASRIYDLITLGHLDAHRDGRRLLFRRADLDAAIQHP